ncbi:hypothetical protein V6N13_058886 [Hibiscus sabdariffa]
MGSSDSPLLGSPFFHKPFNLPIPELVLQIQRKFCSFVGLKVWSSSSEEHRRLYGGFVTDNGNGRATNGRGRGWKSDNRWIGKYFDSLYVSTSFIYESCDATGVVLLVYCGQTEDVDFPSVDEVRCELHSRYVNGGVGVIAEDGFVYVRVGS